MFNDSVKFNLPTLADRAVLVRLKRSMYNPYAFDAQATAKIEADSNVVGCGRFNKRLFKGCLDIEDTNAAFNAAYQYAIKHTVPWLDDGVRMLPSETYFEFTDAMRDLINTAKRKADALAAKWDALVAADVARLKQMGNPLDYPTDVRSKYDIRLNIFPVPSATDFRVAVSDEDRASLQSAISEAEAGVAKYLLAELLDPVKKAVAKLSVPIGQDGAVFRNTLITNITDMATRARKLNISKDPTVDALVNEINGAISAYATAPDLLREDIGARNDAQAKLNNIMSKMAGLF